MRSRLSLFLHISLSVWVHSAAEGAEVSCGHLQSCVLPCAFEPGPGPIINWFKKPNSTSVYSINNGRLQHIDKEYKERTSLIGEVSRGNASLLLTEVRVHDDGDYLCWTSTTGTGIDATLSSSVTVRVRAPVSQVSVHQEGQQLLCRSKETFPRPDVAWTPSSDPQTKWSVSEQGLFSVESSVSLSNSVNRYICNISSDYDWRSATYWKNSQISFSDDAVAVRCIQPRAEVKRLIWKFNCEAILTRTGSEKTVYREFWKPFVDQHFDSTESNDLVLRDLTQDQQGLFTCEVSTDTEDFIIITEVIKASQLSIILVTVSVTLAILLVVTCYVIIWMRKRMIALQTPHYGKNPVLPEFALLPRDSRVNHEEDAAADGVSSSQTQIQQIHKKQLNTAERGERKGQEEKEQHLMTSSGGGQ